MRRWSSGYYPCHYCNWGKQGPARDRFYAFDKDTGDLVWSSTPGITPKDSSFAPLTFEDLPDGRRVFYSGTGCGHVVCIDALIRTGFVAFQMSYGGVNAGIVIHNDSIIAVHGKENIDSTIIAEWVPKKPDSLPGLDKDILVLGRHKFGEIMESKLLPVRRCIATVEFTNHQAW